MAQLTKMQQKIYDYIAQAIQDQGYPPSVREIGEAVGLKSPSTVHFHLKHLEELGFVAGDTVTIVSSLNGNVIVKVKESRVAISEEMARKIMV